MADKFVLTAQLQLQAPKNVKQVHKQMQNQLKGVSVDVDVQGSAKAAKDLKKVAAATRQVEKDSKSAKTAADRMGKAFGSALKNVLRYDLARRVFTAFTNTVEQGVQDAIKFEREMIKIAQVSGQTMKELKGLQNTITSLARGLGVASSSLVKVGLILKQTGLSVKDTEIAMAALAKSELAPTFDNIADTAETAVAAMRQFGIEASRLEGLLSKINTVAGNFAVEASDIGVAIKRTGGAFKAAGGQVEELIALFTSVRATTRETAETIATGFRTIFTRLQRPTTIKFLREFGIELTDLQGKFVGPYEAVRRLSSALQNLSPQDLRFSTIVEQLGGFRQVSKVIPLIQQFGTAQAALNAQLEGQDSLAKDAATAQQSLAVQMQKVTEGVKDLFREIAASDAFQALAGMALKLASAITQIGKALAPVLPILTAFVAARAAAWAGGKLFSGGVGNLNKALGTASGDASDVFRGNRGGRVRRFSNGGWVPGTGNGDTVPAMLEPGEFVLRKSAAQAFGPQLSKINKYNDGGKSKQQPTLKNAHLKSTYDGDSYSIVATPDATPWNTSTRAVGYDAYELKSGTPAEKKLGQQAKALAAKHAESAGYENDAEFTKLFQDSGGSFPSGKDKYGRPKFDDPALKRKLLAQGLATKRGTKATTDDDEILIQRSLGNKNLARRLRAMGMKLPQDQKEKKLASGGMVPSLLTPGEFVVNKKSAQAFGYGKLHKMNKYAGGGTVGGFKRFQGGGLLGGGGGLMNLAFMSNFANSTTKATKGLYGMAEGAFGAYTKIQFMSASANAVGTQLGLGGKTLDAFTGILGQSLGIIAAFNTVMKAATVSAAFEAAGGSIMNFATMLSSKGAIGKAVGGRISAVGAGIKAKNIGPFAGMANAKSAKSAELFTKATAQSRAAVTARVASRAKATKLADARKAFEGMAKGSPERLKAGRALGGLTKSANAAKAHAAELTKTAKAAKTANLATLRASKRANLLAKGFKALNVASFVATYAISKFGESIEQDALKGIAETRGKFDPGEEERLKTKAGRGGALAGAGIGLGIALAIPGVNLLAGLAIVLGAAWIGLANSTEKAARAIKRAKFEGAMDDMAAAMDLVGKNQLTASAALAQTVNSLNTMTANTGGFDAADGPARVSKGFHTIAQNSTTLINKLGESSRTVAEFEAKLDGNVDALKTSGFISEKQISVLREEVAARERVQEKLKAFAKAQEEAAQALAKIKNIAQVFDEVGERMKTFGGVIDSISDPSSTAGIGPGLASQIRPGAGDPESIQNFENALQRMGDLTGRTGLGSFVGQAKDIGFLQRNLESILARAGAGGKLDPERAQERIATALQDRLEQERGEGETLGPAVQRHFNTILRGLGDDVVSDIKGNMDKIQDAFMSGQEEFIEQFKKGAQLMDQHTQDLIKAYAAKRALDLQEVQNRQSLLKKSQDAAAEFASNMAMGQLIPGRTNSQIQAEFNERQRVALAAAGDFDGGDSGKLVLESLVGDVNGLGEAFKKVSQALIVNRQQISDAQKGVLAGQGGVGDSVDNLVKKNDELAKQYTILKGVLQAYGNSQERLVVLNRELAQSQKRDQSIRDLAIKTRFGTAEEKDQAARIVNAVAVARDRGSIDAVAPELQRQVISLLQQGILGQEGLDILNSGLTGFGKGVTSASKQTEEINKKILEAKEIGIAAGKAVNEEMKNRSGSMESAIVDQNRNFLSGLKRLLEHKQKQELQQDMRLAREEMTRMQQTYDLLRNLGIDPTKGDQAQAQVEALKTQSNRFVQLEKLQAQTSSNIRGNFESISDLKAGLGVDNFNQVIDKVDGWFRQNNTEAGKAFRSIFGGGDNISDILGEGWTTLGTLNASMSDFLDETDGLGMRAMFGGESRNIEGYAGQTRSKAFQDSVIGNIFKTFGHLFEDERGDRSSFFKMVSDAFEQTTDPDVNANVNEFIGQVLAGIDQREGMIRSELETLRKGSVTEDQMRRFEKLDASSLALLEDPINNLIDNFTEAQRKYNEAIETWNSFGFKFKGEALQVINTEPKEQLQQGFQQKVEAERRAKEEETRQLNESIKEVVKNVDEATKLRKERNAMNPDELLDSMISEREAIGRMRTDALKQTQSTISQPPPKKEFELGTLDRFDPRPLPNLNLTVPQDKVEPKPLTDAINKTIIGPDGIPPAPPRDLTSQKNEAQNVRIVQGGGVKPLGDGTPIGDRSPEADAAITRFKDVITELQRQAREVGASDNAIRGANSPEKLQRLIDFQKKVNASRSNAPTIASLEETIRGLERILGGGGGGSAEAAKKLEEARKSLKVLQDQVVPNKSIGTYDKTAEAILTELLAVMKGNPGRKDAVFRGATGATADGVSGAYASIDTTDLDKSIQNFSKDLNQLATILGSPMTIEVGGTVEVNVSLNGAEFLSGAETQIGRYVGFKVTQGINNFIRQGLKDTRVTTRTKWDDDDTSSQTMSGNSSGGTMA